MGRQGGALLLHKTTIHGGDVDRSASVLHIRCGRLPHAATGQQGQAALAKCQVARKQQVTVHRGQRNFAAAVSRHLQRRVQTQRADGLHQGFAALHVELCEVQVTDVLDVNHRVLTGIGQSGQAARFQAQGAHDAA